MPHLIANPVGPDLMLYDTDSDAVHALNPAARAIYEACREGMAPEAIESMLRSRFQISPDTPLQQDVQNTLALLKEKQLL